MLLGAHESVAGGAWNAIARGRADGCEALQIFARPAPQWRARPLPPDEVSMFRSEHATVAWPAMSHASYLINLCAGDPVILERAATRWQDEMLPPRSWASTSSCCTRGRTWAPGARWASNRGGRSLSELHERTRGVRVRPAAGDHRRSGELPRLPVRRHGGILERRAAATGSASASTPATRTRRARSQHRGGLRAGVRRRSRARSASTACARFTSTTPRRRRAAASTATPRSATATWACCRSGGWSTTRASPTAPGVLETPSGADKLPSFARNLARLRA